MCDPETLNQILETLIEFKDEIKTMREEFQRVHEEFEQLKQLIIEGNGKHICEINTALQTISHLHARIDQLEALVNADLQQSQKFYRMFTFFVSLLDRVLALFGEIGAKQNRNPNSDLVKEIMSAMDIFSENLDGGSKMDKVLRNRYSCPLCPQNNFTSSKAVDEHLIRHHVGKMSRESFEYLLECGVPPDKIIEWCRRNGVKLKFDIGQGLNCQLKLTAFAEV